MQDPQERNRASAFPISLAGISLYAAFFFWICRLKFDAYLYGDFDLAIDSQSVWNILHGSLQSSIHGIPFLGNHMRLILFLVAPLYLFFQTPLLLLNLQTLVLASGAAAIYKMAEDDLPTPWPVLLSLLYLIYPPLLYLNLYEFHPVALASGFMLWMLYYLRKDRFIPFTVFMVLALLCQENIALILIPLPLLAWIWGRRGRWIYTPLLTGIIYVLIVALIMPDLNAGKVGFSSLYGHFGNSLPEATLYIAKHPLESFMFMLNPLKLAFLIALLAPLAFVSLAGIEGLLPVLLVLAQRLLSQRGSEFSIQYHYQAEFIPFIFLAAIIGIRRLLFLKRPIVAPALIGSLVLLTIISIGSSGIFGYVGNTVNRARENRELAGFKDEIVSQLPADASILATFDFLPKFSNRRHLYSFHHVYSGFHTLSPVPYECPPVRFLAMDTLDSLTFDSTAFHSTNSYQRIQALLTDQGWTTIALRESVLVLRRTDRPEDARLPVRVLDALPDKANTRVTTHPQESSGFQLAGFQHRGQDDEGNLMLILYWTTPTGAAQESVAHITLDFENTSSALTRPIIPGHRIWPPQSWPAGKIIAEEQRLLPPANVRDPVVTGITAELFPADGKP